MTKTTQTKFKELQKIDFSAWIATTFLVKRDLIDKVAKYSVLRLKVEGKLLKKLKDNAVKRIQDNKYKLEEYQFLSADQDEQLYTLEASETDFSKIQDRIEQGLDVKSVENYEDLINSWAYVLKLESDGKVIYAVRKINKYTKPAKLTGIDFFIFNNKQLEDFDDKKIFSFDLQLDFFVYDEISFITNKKEFENSMNFRDGMEKNRDSVLDEFSKLKIFNDVEPLRKSIGTNLHLLRKVSSIQKSGYYKNPEYLKKLISVNEQEGWGLIIDNGMIVINDDNVDLILTLLNNGRLKSLINQEVFDATVKKKVG